MRIAHMALMVAISYLGGKWFRKLATFDDMRAAAELNEATQPDQFSSEPKLAYERDSGYGAD